MAWLALLEERPELAIGIEYHGVNHATRLSRQAVVAALAPLWHSLAARAGSGARVVVDYRLARFPGRLDAWPAAHALPADAALRGASASAETFVASAQGISLCTSLAVVPDAAGFAPRLLQAPPIGTPTHLLTGHRAVPLVATPVYLTPRGGVAADASQDAVARVVRDGSGCRLVPLPGREVLLNGRPLAAPRELAAGDHVSVPGTTTLFVPIEVVEACAPHVH
jgi:hypothetical protein